MADPQHPVTLAEMVRAKYPGVYDDLSDADLDRAVRAKFPGTYDDIPQATGDAPLGSRPMGPGGDVIRQNLPAIGATLATIGTEGAAAPLLMAALGGSAGKTIEDYAEGQRDPAAMLTDAAKSGLVQGVAQGAGQIITRGAQMASPLLQRSAIKLMTRAVPGASELTDAGTPAVDTILNAPNTRGNIDWAGGLRRTGNGLLPPSLSVAAHYAGLPPELAAVPVALQALTNPAVQATAAKGLNLAGRLAGTADPTLGPLVTRAILALFGNSETPQK